MSTPDLYRCRLCSVLPAVENETSRSAAGFAVYPGFSVLRNVIKSDEEAKVSLPLSRVYPKFCPLLTIRFRPGRPLDALAGRLLSPVPYLLLNGVNRCGLGDSAGGTHGKIESNCPVLSGKNFTYILKFNDQIGDFLYFPSPGFYKVLKEIIKEDIRAQIPAGGHAHPYAIPLSFSKFPGLRRSSHTPPHLLAHATNHESYCPSLLHSRLRSALADERDVVALGQGHVLVADEHSDDGEFENREENEVGDDGGDEQGTTTAAPRFSPPFSWLFASSPLPAPTFPPMYAFLPTG
ncbi:unnamed protein product [Linum tenue]|uniref:Uncharacterized protein n=1 Tax=Linum tenue TaxID=586396 RepID=A0AAV0R2A8_9ROSI|nr:unnamed protein product [Linum tenue]